MLTEQHRLSYFPELTFGRKPHLPVYDTEDIIDHMPTGRWEIPQVPYTFFERIEENDLDFMKAYKIESFQRRCRELIANWIPFLKSVERGDRIARRFMEEHVLTTDLPSIENYNLFNEVLRQSLRKTTAWNLKMFSLQSERHFYIS